MVNANHSLVLILIKVITIKEWNPNWIELVDVVIYDKHTKVTDDRILYALKISYMKFDEHSGITIEMDTWKLSC